MDNNNFETEDITGMFDTDEIEQNKIITVIAYIPPLFFLPLIASGSSKYAKFHANQACIVTLLSVIGSVVSRLFNFVVGWIPVVGKILTILVSVALGIILAVFVIIGIMNAAQGKAKKLPLIGNLIEVIK